MNQIKAGLKKESFFFLRSFRLIGMIVVFLGCSLFIPLMFGAMNLMGDAFDTIPEAQESIQEIYGENFDVGNLFGMFEGDGGLMMAYTGTLEMFGTASLGSIPLAATIVLILLTGTAGQEQKKRSIILPQTAGLKVTGYVLPKFIMYPPMMFAATLVSIFLVNAVSHGIFGVSYSFEVVLLTGLLAATSMAFIICLYLFLGLSLAQPGLSVIYVLAGQTIFTSMITLVFEIDRYTPWSLVGMSYRIVNNYSAGINIYEGIELSSILTTIGITLILCVLFMMFTLFALTAKRMDNTADEIY
ncbi:MAG: hypothetical protein FWF94_01130 [Oscillospiraceae bacterium]|nr:hypothetical protein [Oscillospiraceae bacterium]